MYFIAYDGSSGSSGSNTVTRSHGPESVQNGGGTRLKGTVPRSTAMQYSIDHRVFNPLL